MPVSEVAIQLLGCVLRHETERGPVAVVITEVEAYGGADDPASHAYRGLTPRNAAMFGPPGHLYVYRSYGIHWCANVVVGETGTASAVLLRAGRLIEGREVVRDRRGERVSERDLTRGPGRLCQAMGISGAHDGVVLDSGPLTLGIGAGVAANRVRSGPRVGVSRAHEVPWRFWIDGEPSVSAYKVSPRAPRV